MRILKLTPETQNDILQNLLKRSPNNYGEFEGTLNKAIDRKYTADMDDLLKLF